VNDYPTPLFVGIANAMSSHRHVARARTASSSSSGADSTLTLDGYTVSLTRLTKVMYPGNGFTKAHVIDYYVRAAEVLLPHLRDRPVTLKRYPNGVKAEAYWDKDAPSFTPGWVDRFPVPRHAGGPDIQYILIQNTATLAWTANIAALELHPFLHRKPDIMSPTSVVFDLDPGEGADIFTCIEVALLLRDVFDRLDLQAFPKVSGSKGVQLYVPLNTPTSYQVTQSFARTISELIERQHPHLTTAVMAKEKRARKVFIDWSQNADHKTTVGVYSLRGKRDIPFVSMPVAWRELESARKRHNAESLFFDPASALKRVDKLGDLFDPVLRLKQTIPTEVAAAIQSHDKPKPPSSLQEYERKRDFAQTPEPDGASLPRRSRQGGRRRFVIQKHAASHLHYDFRLEIGGVLKSWAVPKGPPLQPGVRRLASATEDHPMEYLDFEGTIPQGQYGGGTVMVWDIGTFEIVEGNYWKGRLHIGLSGCKLNGEFLLIRDKQKGANAWTLERFGTDVRPITVDDDSSCVTGRSMAQIARDNDKQWQSNRATSNLDQLPSGKAQFFEPMQCRLESKLPESSGWQYEAKLDGYRALAIKSGGDVSLLSRRNNALSGEFPEIVEALRGLPDDTVIDGEIVALDKSGRPSFNQLQNRRLGRDTLRYYAFDVLVLRGRQLLDEPLSRRREELESVLTGVKPPVYKSAALHGVPEDLLSAARQHNLEGIIAKRLDSRYEPGKRSGEWIKVKINQDQELVIGGYLPAAKRHFDALLVGYYEGSKLIFAGKIRNGFKEAGSKERVFARFKGQGTDRCPFDNLPEPANARRGMALTAEAMKLCCWLKPKLVAQIGIREWTPDRHLRHASFLGLRDDKNPRDVVLERS
jgi:bifunctional non-homologous end joining protein LigD